MPVMLLAAAATLSLAACGQQAPAKDPTTDSSDSGTTEPAAPPANDPATLEGWGANMRDLYEGVEVTIAAHSHPSIEAFRTMDADFTALTGIKVNWDVMEQTSLKNKQLLDFTSNTGIYDVHLVDPFAQAEFVDKGVIAPLNTYLDDAAAVPAWFDYADIVPAYSSVDDFGGEIFGLPIAGETRFLGYRTDLFAKHGKTPPTTMAEFLELAEFFDTEEEGVYGIAMRAQRGIHFGSGLMSIMYPLTDGFIDQKTGKATMDDPEMVAALQYYVDLLSFGPPDIANYTHEEALSAFAAGRTAMWFDASAIAPRLLDPEQSEIADVVDFVTPPDGPKGEAAAIAGWRMALASKSANPGAAMALMTYLASKEMAPTYVGAGGVPTRVSQFSAPSTPAEEKIFPVVLASLEKAKAAADRGVSYVPANPNLGQIMDRIGYYGSLAQAGELSVEEAAKQAQAELVELTS
ncbi:MAG: sugar ABC transporter substrate-binding protein [Actinomycetota bacterium]|nr:sugar ABC transporter substrate-binding protein [Actinomycetota bacterium]